MKLIISKLFFISAIAMMLGSCKKDEAKQFYSGGYVPALKASVSGIVPLNYATKDLTGVVFSWTNPDYVFASGISSQDVAYTLEIDITGNNFAGPNKLTISIAKDLAVTYTQDQFNTLLAGLNLTVGTAASIDVRLNATMNGNVATLVTSNTLTFNVTTYNPPPKVTPPSSGTLFIVGSAVPGVSGWNNPITGGASQVALQQFTKVSNTLYTLTTGLVGGGSYQFVPNNGNWNGQCGIPVKNDPSEVNGGVFTSTGGNDILAPSVSGTYKIDVDFQKGIFKVTKQ